MTKGVVGVIFQLISIIRNATESIMEHTIPYMALAYKDSYRYFCQYGKSHMVHSFISSQLYLEKRAANVLVILLFAANRSICCGLISLWAVRIFGKLL